MFSNDYAAESQRAIDRHVVVPGNVCCNRRLTNRLRATSAPDPNTPGTMETPKNRGRGTGVADNQKLRVLVLAGLEA